MAAGKFRDLLAFEVRQAIDDGMGNEVSGDFVEQFRDHAEMAALRGSETVMASRLSGKQPFLVTVRCHTNTMRVTPDWRAVNARTGVAYAITTSVVRPKRDYVDLTCIEGVAE
jgi:head-tail adaptor